VGGVPRNLVGIKVRRVMIDAYTHVDMSAARPLEDLEMQMQNAGVTAAFVIETWDKRNRVCMQQLIGRASAQFRGAFCFRADEQEYVFEQSKSPYIAGMRVRTADLTDSFRLADRLEESGKWLVAHAESGIGTLRDGLLRLAGRNPRLTVYVPHLGWPRRNGEDDQDWRAAMGDLSSLPGCIVGISAMAAFSNEPYPHRDVYDFAIRLQELFGPRRIMIGSDYPLLPNAMYSQYMALAQQWSQSLSGPSVGVRGPGVELFSR
jgi:predicted TIM-barrel fold metal-dependent hydrolase